MTRRRLSDDERALWRESNRYTTRRAKEEDSPPPQKTAEPPSTPKPAASTSVIKKTTSLAPLSVLNASHAKRTFAQRPIEATLDLHGLTRTEAYASVKRFITRHHARGTRHVVVITGKGRGETAGILRALLPDWLNDGPLRPLLSSFAIAPRTKGGEGVTHILLKRRREDSHD